MADGEAGKVPVQECVTDAWKFFRQHGSSFMAGAVLIAVVGALPALVGGAEANAGLAFPLFAISLVAGSIFNAMVLRQAIRHERIGVQGLSFGAEEMRVVSLALLLGLVISLPSLIAFIPMLALLGERTAGEYAELFSDPKLLADALLAVLGPTGAAAAGGVMLLCLAMLIFVGVRLSLALPATIGEKKFVLFETWRWTHGNFWRVFAAMLLIVLPVTVVTGLISIIVTQTGLPAVLALLIVNFIGALGSVPQLALGAVLYKGLRPPDFVAK